ncbi:MAG: GIY-YIG nuclease family protein [Pirellulales bacterium]|nr:GIY-YIG nuclease family protein [Pirellulales bacterium]
MRGEIRRAFVEVSQGFSSDRIVADPGLNALFIGQCRKLGLSEPARELNALLLNARKSGALSGLPRARRTSFPDEVEYRFASEVAARYLEHRDQVTVDQILCDPDRASEFDSIAERIAPGHTPLQYRWAALNLRKAKLLRPEPVSHVAVAPSVDFGPATAIQIDQIPVAPGIYIFYGPSATLYVGETENLRRRIGKHLDHSDNKGLAHWFWENGFSGVNLEIRILPAGTGKRVRCALECELIRSRIPLFNIQCT